MTHMNFKGMKGRITMEKSNDLPRKGQMSGGDRSKCPDLGIDWSDVFRSGNPSKEDLLLPTHARITCREIIKSYGKRVDELRREGKVTQKKLAEVCGVSSQTISNIIKGVDKSINPVCCNKLAQYFDCTVFYLLGIADKKDGIEIENKQFTLPIIRDSMQDVLYVIQAGQWARIDADLFVLLEKVFKADIETRNIIGTAIKQMLK